MTTTSKLKAILIILFLFFPSHTLAFNQPFRHYRRNINPRYIHSEHHHSLDDDEKVFSTQSYLSPKHWVLKVGDLRSNLIWFERNFNFTVFRHEEFSSGCEATCNGPYGGAWSKTMIGRRRTPDGRAFRERDHFVLELTYNYGVDSYSIGNALRHLEIDFRCLVEQSDADANPLLHSPDGYPFKLIRAGAGDSSQSLRAVSLHVSDLRRSERFYRDVLGSRIGQADQSSLGGALVSFESYAEDERETLRISFPADDFALELSQSDTGRGGVAAGSGSGRLAIETADGAADALLEAMQPWLGQGSAAVLHGPMRLASSHNETVLIVRDPDAHEICFVDARGLQNCSLAGERPGGSAVNWTLRQEVEDSARRKMAVRQSDADAEGWGAVRLASKGDAAALLRSLAAASSSSSQQQQQQGVLLEVFAPWCSTCSKIKPLLSAAAEELQQVGVSVVAVDGSPIAGIAGPGLDEPDDDASSEELQVALQFTKMTGYPGLYLFRRESDGGLASSSYDGRWNLLGLLRWVLGQADHPDLTAPSAELLARHAALKEQLRGLGVPVDDEDEGDEEDCDQCSL